MKKFILFMQALEYTNFKKVNSYNSLECSCEKINLQSSRKKIAVCELCSEKKFLRENSTKFSDSLSSSLSESL